MEHAQRKESCLPGMWPFTALISGRWCRSALFSSAGRFGLGAEIYSAQFLQRTGVMVGHSTRLTYLGSGLESFWTGLYFGSVEWLCNGFGNGRL